ncbi:coiled-coil domain-containing protein 77 isoform X2 [Amia ocellicauda]|uniref:coiled-coil domain-containing protein 77 isoform X2 n=1 Tax=Amia ocellicauda TaxID=2972642 RepID=UPI00346420C9
MQSTGTGHEDEFDFLFKIILIGDSNVGKTCVVQSFKTGIFTEMQQNTIGVDFTVRTLDIEGKRLKLAGMSQPFPSGYSPGQDVSSPLPSMNKRLEYLHPSRELLEFYRCKVAEFDGEHEELLQLLEKYKSTVEEQHKLQWEMRQREGEITQLQKALSDMQVYLFQEREQSLRLYAENDRLKIRELGDRKKIQRLLLLIGPDTGEIVYLHKELPHKVTIPEKQVQDGIQVHIKARKTVSQRKVSKGDGTTESLESPQNYMDSQTLLLQVEALQAQMEEQTKLAKEQVESLLEDRRIRVEEAQMQNQRDQDRISSLTDKLHRTQGLLYESTRDFLKLKFECRANEKNWMAEKDRLLRELDTCKERLQDGHDPNQRIFHLAQLPDKESPHVHKEEIKAIEEQFKQAHRLADMYREQCVSLESELAQIRERGDVSRDIFKERSQKMAKRLELLTKRYEALEKRRSMEVEGFKTDIKHLRQKLKEVEKQLFKVTLNVGPDQDLAILDEVRQTNTRTKHIQGDLKILKAKIYELENELRFC